MRPAEKKGLFYPPPPPLNSTVFPIPWPGQWPESRVRHSGERAAERLAVSAAAAQLTLARMCARARAGGGAEAAEAAEAALSQLHKSGAVQAGTFRCGGRGGASDVHRTTVRSQS